MQATFEIADELYRAVKAGTAGGTGKRRL